MTKRASSKRKTKSSAPAAQPQSFEDILKTLLQPEVAGLVLLAVGIVTGVALVSQTQGKLSEAWSLFLRQVFGVGAYPVALLMIVCGILLLLRDSLQGKFTPPWRAIVWLEVLFFAGLGLLHVLAPGDPLTLAQAGQYGGHIGWTISQILVPLFGRTVAIIFISAIVLSSLCLATGTSLRGVGWRIRWLWAQIALPLRNWLEVQQTRPPQPPARRPVAPNGAAPNVAAPNVASPAPKPAPRRVSAPKASAAPAAMPITDPAAAQTPPASRPTTRGAPKPRPLGTTALPSLDLLTPDAADKADDSDVRMRAQISEETLEAFGIPAEVVEWNRGPVVTQFGVEPGYIEKQDKDGNTRRYKIRVSKILSLTNDLALALAASPIRLEAPVPGRSMIGIEVPNGTKTMVGMRGVLESEVFRKMRSPLRIALGRDVSGEAVVADLAAMPHLLIAGATGSGKSVCMNACIASLLFQNTPDELKLIMVDPKRVELTNYNGIPHLIAPVVVDIEKVIVALRWLIREMDRRYEQFAQIGVRNLRAYNKAAKSKGLDPLPMIVVFIDELADLMLAAADDVERTLCRLAQMARATGIHLVLATQRPSVDVVTGLIKANFPARISFAVTSQIDSRVILDVPGAEKLLGRGDMLFMAPDAPGLQRIQGCFVSDKELDALVSFWRNATPAEEEEPEAPWEDMGEEDDADEDILNEAIELVRQHNQASASFLQRHMRIGYPRAARLIDQLEKLGVVGPQESGGRSR
ncbi:MAG: DNA translocase FtsK, partial [Chloroflexi bacterium]|nr:DNA translocase FtsK [Chloroflexota bacterium]